jgi:hypothetical protein
VGLYSNTCPQVDVAFDLFKDIHEIGNISAQYNTFNMLIVCSIEACGQDIPLPYHFMMNKHGQFYILTYNVVERILGCALIKAQGHYNDYYATLKLKNSWGNIQPILVVDSGSLTSQDLTKRLNTFNLVYAVRDILVLEDSNEVQGAIIVKVANTLVGFVSLVLYGAMMSYKIEFSNHVAIELVCVLFALDDALKLISNPIYGNVFKLTFEVYLVALKGYVKMRCSSNIGRVEVGESSAFAVLALWVNHRLNSYVIHLVTSFQQHLLLNYSLYNGKSETSWDNGKSILVHVYDSLAWKIYVAPLHATYHPLTKDSLLIFQHIKLLIVLHRKMIYNGSFYAPKVLIMWKDWFSKHGSYSNTSLGTAPMIIMHFNYRSYTTKIKDNAQNATVEIAVTKDIDQTNFPLALEVSQVFIVYHLNLCTTYLSQKQTWLVLYRFTWMAIFHRKMINRGNVQDAKVLIKWKALPLKHGTCYCSSLRTRMFEGESIVTGIKYSLIVILNN